jgi:hypothetical protein
MLPANMTISRDYGSVCRAMTARSAAAVLTLGLLLACSSDDGRPPCDALYSNHYGKLLIRASEDTSEPWRRAGYHSPAAWAHARAAAAVKDERDARRCK